MNKSQDLSYVNKVGTEPLLSITLGNLLENAAKKYKDRPSIISRHQKKTITFGQLLEEADRLAAAFVAMGLQKGDRVGLCLPNRYEWNIILFACVRADLILVALNPAYQAPELEYCINKVDMRAIICADIFKTQNYYEIIRKICPEISESEPGNINSQGSPSLKHAIFISDRTFKGAYNYEDVLNMSDQNLVNCIKNSQDKISPDSPCTIQFTSGTTGKPKAAVSNHFIIVNSSYETAKRTELDSKHHTVCLQNPLFHALGITVNTMAALHFGTTFVIPGLSYSPNESLDALKEERCTIIYGTPTMHIDLIDVQSKRQENIVLEMAITGGAPCSPELFKKMIDILKVTKIKSVYGLTETSGGVFHSMPDEDEYLSTSTVGHIGSHLEAKVVDSDGQMVPFGEAGELCVRGYAVMLGYWEDEEKTREIIGPDGWLRTGDQFVLEKNGYGRVVGRLKDMIIRGGENIYPREIEDFLDTHPDILETQVVGIPHGRLGEEVCVFVRLKEGRTLNRDKLVDFCKGKISHFKIPSRLEIVKEFDKTASGKIQKFMLKEMLSN